MKKFRKLFLVFFALFFIIFLCHLPGWILEHCYNSTSDKYYNFSNLLREFIRQNKILEALFSFLIYKIPDWTIIPTIVLNGANMVFGFVNFKKKWWYYLLLAISIFLSFVLFDYYQISLDPME